MWMMGYNETHEDHHLNMNMVESYTNNGTRKLRPLAPKPPPPSCATSSSNRFPSAHLDHHLLPINHHLAEHNKREFHSQQMVVVSSRWNPTPEQLQTLEELYRRGTRTPSAEEIQHITAQLRRFGKIEGKNVFYWFQNHKARERQKRRRQLDKPTNDMHQPPFFTTDNINTIHLDQSVPRKDSGFEETKNWAIRTFSEKSVLREKQEYRMTNVAGDHHEAWEQQYQEQEQDNEDGNDDDLLLIQRRRKSNPTRNATWTHMMQSLSCSSTAPSITNNNHITLINNNSIKTSSSFVISPHDDVDSNQTLQLFPVNNNSMEQPDKCFIPVSDVSLSPRQFIEFLPLKN